jgi:dTDP-4-amino-4,6-dideoxygalactose transaminase
MTPDTAPIDDRYAPPSAREMDELARTLAGGILSGGAPVIAEYENALAERFGARHAIAVNSGSSALYATLAALGAGPGRSVALPSFAPLPTLLPILALGAAPILVDNRPGSLALSSADLAAKLREDTVAVISVPLWGYPADTHASDVAGLLEINGVALIEDAAQAHGTLIEGEPAGTRGIAGCFSTHDRKLLPTGEGGFILTDDEALFATAEAFTRLDHLRGNTSAVNFKLAAPLAAIGLARLPQLEDQLETRAATAAVFLDAARGTGFTEPAFAAGGRPNYYTLVLLAPGDPDKAAQAFNAAGLPPDSARWHYRPLHRRDLLGEHAVQCPNADDLARRALHIPVHPGMTPRQIESVAYRIRTLTAQLGDTA